MSIHAVVHNTFNIQRHLTSRRTLRVFREIKRSERGELLPQPEPELGLPIFARAKFGSRGQRRFDTCWAGDGPAALAFVENDPKLAVVISDIVMPGGVSGLDLARTLRDRRPELPVILTTGYTSHASEVAAEGFVLIEKPYRREVLAASLRSALENRGRSVAETLTGF